MSRFLYRIGRGAAHRPWTVIGVWTVLLITVVGASGVWGRTLEDSFEVPGLDSQQAIELLSAAASDRAGLTAQVVVTPDGTGATLFDQDAIEALALVQDAVGALPNVLATSDLAGMLAEGPEAATLASGAISADGRVGIVAVQYPVLEELTVDDLAALKEVRQRVDASTGLQVEVGGDLFGAIDDSETGTNELIGVVAAVVILLVAFGSVVAMGLPIGMALFGLALGVSALSLITYLIEIPAYAPTLASMGGLGVGIDYALFLVTRHREHLAAGVAMEESIGRAVATAGQAVIFAGGTVVVAILGLAVAGIPFVTAGGVAVSFVVALMVVASLTLLPALLGLAGDRVNGLRARSRERNQAKLVATGGVSPGWERWGRHVANHAWPYAVGVTLLLLAATAPVLWLELGFADDSTLPESRTERRAYDLVADGFGPGTNGPLLIAIDLSAFDLSAAGGTAEDGADLGPIDERIIEPLAAAIAADPGVTSVLPPAVDVVAEVATIVANPTTPPQDQATVATVERLRAEVLPSVLQHPDLADVLGGVEVTAHVGGQTAAVTDVGQRVTERLPYFVLAVVLLSFALLAVLFRSILVAVKAALLNLLSIGAAYGVLVMVFQWGWGKELIGLETTVPITSFIPLFLFAMLFGLSMDYEVFLLSRVREEYLITGDNDRSVIRGIAVTARVITSAALIMISVFGGFVLAEDPTLKMFGLGLATAILVDATIVRLVLVPATMKLMGDANWWLPAWLDRLLPVIDIEGGGGPVAGGPESVDIDEVDRDDARVLVG